MEKLAWGEFEIDRLKEVKLADIVLPNQKAAKLRELRDAAQQIEKEISETKEVELKNPLVTQTIEVMNQTEMLQTLIDTYANKTGYNNYVLSQCEMIPQVDFPPENAVNLLNEDKFVKPLWFMPPIQTEFTRSSPKNYPKINTDISRRAIRKSICGLLRIAGFSDASHNALVMFTDTFDEFMKSFLQQIKDIQVSNGKEKSTEIDIITLEKAYTAISKSSLLKLHTYYKKNIIAKNHKRRDEFNRVYREYNRLMQESQKATQRDTQFKEDDYMNFLDFTTTVATTTTTNEATTTTASTAKIIKMELDNPNVT